MFGQWSLWAKQLYFNRLVHATPKQRAAFITRTVAVSGAIANIGYQTNTDMWNWLAPLSLNYGGGPVVQSAVDARNLWIAPMEQKPAAARRLASSIGSLAFPAQLAFVDLNRALDEQDPRQAALRMTLGRPLNDSNFNYDWVINPATTDPGPMRVPAPGMDLRGLPLVTDRLESGVR
jgi:hypothetical protein